jgi:dipeptidyl aminopeptidase/acylaminoacyl peptidase
MKTALLVAALAASTAASAAAAAEPLTPALTLNRRTIGELEFSPDGRRLVFTVTEPVTGSTRPRSIWLLEIASGRLRQLTFSGKSDGSPRWSPDGSSIAFTSDRDGTSQLYLLPMRGGEAERLIDRKERVEMFRWSPDGRQIALLMNESKPEVLEQRERNRDDARVVDKDERRARVWTIDVETRALRQVTAGPWQMRQIEWLPDGRRLVAAATDHPETDRWIDGIYTIDLEHEGGGRFERIAAPQGPFGNIVVSPDGRRLAYIGARVDGPLPHDLYLMPLADGRPQNVTAAAVDRPIGQPKWIDNETLAIHVQRGFTSALATIGRDAKPHGIDGLGVNPIAYARSKDGTLAFVGDSTTKAPELFVKPPSGPARAVSTFNERWDAVPLVAPEFIKYKSDDGVEIEAALLKPQPSALSAEPSSRRRPLIVLVHGGPTGRWSDSFEPWGQLLAARGYLVLYPNVRGSTGYGQKFVEMNRGDWGGGDFKDVMAGVDALIARGVADPNRLGIGGWSYGGYMAAWAVTQTTRFRASVSGAPVIDLASEFGTEDGSQYDEWFYGTPYEKLEGFIRSSPITFVKNVKTPTLLLQGDADETDPIGQSQQFYRGLKRYDVPSDFVVYPREPHGLREEQHLLDRLERILAWFDKYLE